MVLGALQPMFDHGIAYHLRDLASAEYADDRLQFKRKNGEEIFRDVNYIPMRPEVRSLNLSNAVAVAVYEAWRQTGFTGGR